MRRLVFAGLAVLAITPSVFAQVRETGFLDRTVAIDTVVYPYQVYVPGDYDPEVRWPVILFLHGAGERGSDGLLQTEVGLPSALRRHADWYPAIVVLPQAPAETRWTGAPGEAAMAALDRTLAEFSTDDTRIYLTGLSMGGNGTWYIAYTHPERFAALVPICGFVAGNEWFPSFVPEDEEDPYAAVARRIRRIPTLIFHGETDPVVPVTESRKMAEALEAMGSPVIYTELPGTGHASWDAAYGSPSLVEWLFRQRR